MPYNGLVSGKILNYQMFQIFFYETEKGKRPAEEFLLSLNPKMRAKMTGLIGILGERGNELRMPYSEYLGDGIFELRCIQGSDITRVLYFFYVGRTIILTGGFVKKQQKTPKSELRLAKLRKKDFLKRYGDNNEDI